MQQETITAIRSALQAFCEDPGRGAESLLGKLSQAVKDAEAQDPVEVIAAAVAALEAWAGAGGPRDAFALKETVEPLVCDALQQAADDLEFQESLSIFLETTPLVVGEIEEGLLDADTGDADQAAEAVADVRRTMHTLKAEFGVLGLNAGQKLCHDAETTIDKVVGRGDAFPVDLMLRLVDWVKDYATGLAEDSRGAPPPSDQLLDELIALADPASPATDTADASADATHEPVGEPAEGSAQVPEAETGAQESGQPELGGSASGLPEAEGSGSEAAQAESELDLPCPEQILEFLQFPADNEGRVLLSVSDDFGDTVGEFTGEARSHLADAEAAMLGYESDHEDEEQINLTFRAFHTIKGVAGFLGLVPMVELAHNAEALLDEARADRRDFSAADVDLVLQSGDLIGRMLDGLEVPETAPPALEVTGLLGRLIVAIAETKDAVSMGADDGGPEVPGPEVPGSVVQADSSAAGNPEGASTQPSPAASAATGGVDGPATVLPSQPPGTQPSANPSAPRAAEKPSRKGGRATKVDSAIKVNTGRLDTLVDMVGELVIAQSMVLQDPSVCSLDDQNLTRNIAQVAKITRDLQEAAMALRMVTVKSTFQKMVRLVRDVSGKAGKTIELKVSGEDTELDRNVVEQLADPLVHMIRNACDHGVESPEDREAVGKSREGHLLLQAYHQGGSIVIEIQDDGRGMDRDKLIAKAKQRGLIQGSGEEMSDGDVFQLIFHPGFSTAEKVTDISGRGVGMDVVRKNIEALRGKIEIESVLGTGTTFRMRLPLTLAIIDGMILRCGKERFVLPTLAIEQSFRVEDQPVHFLADRGEMIDVRGKMLPIYRLSDTFDIQEAAADVADGILMVIETDGERCCLLVDEIVGQQQVVIKSLGKAGESVPGVSGGAIMSDGTVALILDVGSLVGESVRVGC